MKSHLFAAAALGAAVLASPAAAQVSGVAVADPAVAIAGAQALQAGYNQIATTFQAQRTQLEQQQQQRTTIVRQFDTNNDGQLSQEEQTAAQANSAVMQQLQTVEQQIAQTQQPITLARAYVVEQLAAQLSPAVQQVVAQKGIQLILNPTVALYMGDNVDITRDITAALNQLAPSVSTTVPQGWQPQQASFNLFQQVQDILLTVAAQQQQAQAQQPAQQQPVQGR